LTAYFYTETKNKATHCAAVFFNGHFLMSRAIAMIFIGVVKTITSAEEQTTNCK